MEGKPKVKVFDIFTIDLFDTADWEQAFVEILSKSYA